MPTIPVNRQTMPRYNARIQELSADSKGLWGELNATRMIAHLRRMFEISLEEYPVEDRSNWFTRSVARWYAFQVPVPWPKGKLKALCAISARRLAGLRAGAPGLIGHDGPLC